MQSLQERGAPSRLPFQTPVFTNEQNEVQLPSDMDFCDILHDAVDNQGRDEGRSGGICCRVGTG